MAEGRELRAELEAAQTRRRALAQEVALPFDPALKQARKALELETQPLRVAMVKAGRSVESVRQNVTSLQSNAGDLVVKQRGAVARREVSLLTATLTFAACVGAFSMMGTLLEASRGVALGLACLSGFASGFVFRLRIKAD